MDGYGTALVAAIRPPRPVSLRRSCAFSPGHPARFGATCPGYPERLLGCADSTDPSSDDTAKKVPGGPPDRLHAGFDSLRGEPRYSRGPGGERMRSRHSRPPTLLRIDPRPQRRNRTGRATGPPPYRSFQSCGFRRHHLKCRGMRQPLEKVFTPSGWRPTICGAGPCVGFQSEGYSRVAGRNRFSQAKRARHAHSMPGDLSRFLPPLPRPENHIPTPHRSSCHPGS